MYTLDYNSLLEYYVKWRAIKRNASLWRSLRDITWMSFAATNMTEPSIKRPIKQLPVIYIKYWSYDNGPKWDLYVRKLTNWTRQEKSTLPFLLLRPSLNNATQRMLGDSTVIFYKFYWSNMRGLLFPLHWKGLYVISFFWHEKAFNFLLKHINWA